jgi:hypothetical protein
MPDRRRLPDSLFVLLGAAVLGLGGVWWTANEPPATEPVDGFTVRELLPVIDRAAAVSERDAFESMVAEMKRRR